MEAQGVEGGGARKGTGGRGSNCCQPYVLVLLVISIYWFNSFFLSPSGTNRQRSS